MRNAEEIRLYDTLTRKGTFYRVVGIDGDVLIIKPLQSLQDAYGITYKVNPIKIRKSDLEKEKLRKLNVPPVIVSKMTQEELDKL